MRVLLAGASGLIGSPLADELSSRGHDVVRLVRRSPAGSGERSWDPASGQLDAAEVAAADAVICLSGAPVGGRRWTTAYKRELMASRVEPVTLLATAVAAADEPPALLCASAVGYYGDTGEAAVDETAPAGQGFLAELCVAWEASAEPAVRAGARVAHLRTGLVLTGTGGLLAQLRPIVRLGLGGPIGSGRQYLPWISLADEVAAIVHVLESSLAGPVNLTAPAPTPNRDFIAELARQVHRPAVLPVPGFALRAVLGELANDALTGQRALPAALTGDGFAFQHPSLPQAISWALAH